MRVLLALSVLVTCYAAGGLMSSVPVGDDMPAQVSLLHSDGTTVVEREAPAEPAPCHRWDVHRDTRMPSLLERCTLP